MLCHTQKTPLPPSQMFFVRAYQRCNFDLIHLGYATSRKEPLLGMNQP